MTSLYEITHELARLDAALQAAGGDVSDGSAGETIAKFAKEYEWQLEGKVDAYGKYWQGMKTQIEGIAAEIERLSKRKQTLNNNIEKLKSLAKEGMEIRGVNKLEGKLFTISIQKNGGAPPLIYKTVVDALPEHLCKPPVREPDAKTIRQLIEAGDAVAIQFAAIGEAGYSVRIK